MSSVLLRMQKQVDYATYVFRVPRNARIVLKYLHVKGSDEMTEMKKEFP